MRVAGLIVLFLISFVIFLIASFPLSLALDWSGARSRGVSFDRAYGTIWSGSVSDVAIIGQPLGRVKINTRPLSLFTGAIKSELEFAGPAGVAHGVVSVGPARINIDNLTANLNVQNLIYLDPRLRRNSATLNAKIGSMAVSHKGECLEGRADLNSDLLTAVGRQWRWDGPMMVGEVVCVDKRPVVDLKNESGPDMITAHATTTDDGYQVAAEVATRNNELVQALIALGFELRGRSYVYEKTTGQFDEAS